MTAAVTPDLDDLIARLRRRVAAGRQSTGRSGSALSFWIASLPAEQRAELRERLTQALERSPGPDQGNPPTPELMHAWRLMKSPAPYADPAPASASTLESAEKRLGFGLPTHLREIYRSVADGGFGPWSGLMPVARVVASYEKCVAFDTQPRWPQGMLPVEQDGPVMHCIDTAGRVVRLDMEQLDDGNSNLLELFEPVAGTLAEWLDAWETGRLFSQDAMDACRRDEIFAEAREQWRQRVETYIDELRLKSPAERAALGLPEKGWKAMLRRSLLHQEQRQ